jgi:hypothetical protein
MKRISSGVLGITVAIGGLPGCPGFDETHPRADAGSRASTESTSPVAPSCAAAGAGTAKCAGADESCCTSVEVEGGTYFRTYDLDTDGGVILPADGGATGEADPAIISGYRLDKYLVTVARFRQFVSAWSNGAGYLPAAGSGKHEHLNGGQGLANSGVPDTYETGWVASDDSNVAPTDDNLACEAPYDTWTPDVGDQETLPINCGGASSESFRGDRRRRG